MPRNSSRRVTVSVVFGSRKARLQQPIPRDLGIVKDALEVEAFLESLTSAPEIDAGDAFYPAVAARKFRGRGVKLVGVAVVWAIAVATGVLIGML